MKIQAPFKTSPDERIRMIQCSLRCLAFGAASMALTLGLPFAVGLVINLPPPFRDDGLLAICWIPVVSFTFSLLAWMNVFHAQSAAHGEWNPAAAQLIWGRVFSAIGVLMSLVSAGFFFCFLLKLFPWQG
ncbi:MAG TPA: hypothetical protein VG754_08130 [Verrucomicrobiae bacterium]|nr:hypothetical protein [Verrucomicrobiae bacterium]